MRDPRQLERGDEGYMLLAVLIMVFMVLLTLSVAAPRIATQLKRDRELETQMRAQQYVRALRLYYRKNHSYPVSIDALEKTNNQRYLRQRYLDPLTGKDDWKLINVGQNKTTVKGFFGKDLPGIGGGLGAASGLGGSGTAGLGGSTTGSSGSAFNSGGIGGQPGSTAGATGTSGSTTGGSTGTGNGLPGVNSQDATSFTGGNTSPIMGVGVPVTGQAILTVNEKDQYEDWEFLYDPRIEALYQKGYTQGASGAASGGGLGNGQAPTATPGSSPFGTSPTAPGTSPFGSSPTTPGQTGTPGQTTTPGAPSSTTPPQ